MKTEEIKSLPVAASTHKAIKLLAAQQGLEMKVVIARAMEVYSSQATPEPEDDQEQISRPSKAPRSPVDKDLATIQKRSPLMAQRLRGLIADTAKVLEDGAPTHKPTPN